VLPLGGLSICCPERLCLFRSLTFVRLDPDTAYRGLPALPRASLQDLPPASLIIVLGLGATRVQGPALGWGGPALQVSGDDPPHVGALGVVIHRAVAAPGIFGRG